MLLAIDTATIRASVALHDGLTLRSECSWEAANMHTVTLMPHIAGMLGEVGLHPKDLQAIAVCIGPGSFTGVRIGVAAAKGLAAACNLPLLGIQTLDILAAAQPSDSRPLYAIFMAGRGRIGYARYRWGESGWEAESDVEIVSWNELAEKIVPPALVVGELDAVGRTALRPLGENLFFPSPACHLRRAGFLADLAWQRWRAGAQSDPAALVPLYAR